MKKLIVVLFALLMLVGCTSKGYSKLSDGSDVIFTGPDVTYTKDDLYGLLKVSSEKSIENDLLKRIANSLEIDLTEVEKEADDMVEMYKSMGYEQAIIAYYGTVDAFKETYMASGIMSKLSEVYIEDNYDKLVKDDKPVKMQLASFGDKETAEKFKNEVAEGTSFEEAATNNGYTTECPESVYLDSDDLPLPVKSYLNETADIGLSSIIVNTTASTDADGNPITLDTYYVLNVVSRDAEEFKEDYKATRLEKTGEAGVKDYLFSKHDIKFYDQDIYEIMKAQYEVLQ